MRLHFPLILLIALVLAGCNKKADFASYPSRSEFQIHNEDYSKAAKPDGKLLPHILPYGQRKVSEETVLFGFFFSEEEEYVEGWAFLVDPSGTIQDSLRVSSVDPPDRTWSEIGDRITVHVEGGMIEPGPNHTGPTDWHDSTSYTVEGMRFKKIE